MRYTERTPMDGGAGKCEEEKKGMKEREISFMDLVMEILLHWRAMAVWMLAGAAILGAFSYVRSYRALQAAGAADGGGQSGAGRLEYQAALEDSLTDGQIRSVNSVLAYEEMYEDKLAYRENSLLMQIDPNHVQKVDLTFYVSSDSRKKASDIERVYEDIVLSGELREYVYVKVRSGKRTENMNEAISLIRGAGSLPEGSNTFRVRVSHFDEDVCQGIAQAIVDFLEQKHDGLAQIMGEHGLTVINQSHGVMVDTDILERQKNAVGDLALIETTIMQNKEAFTPEQQQYYDCLAAEEDDGTGEQDQDSRQGAAKEEIKEEGAASPGISKKYVVLGMFLALFAYVAIYFLRYVLTAKIHATDNLQELYGIPHLGLIAQPAGDGKAFGFVDRWLLSLRGQRSFTREEALRLSEVAIKMEAAKKGIGRVCLIGCDLTGQSLAVCKAVQKGLAQGKVQVDILNNVLYDAQAMGALEGAECAVLVERAGSTLYSEVARELELLARQGILALGGIVVA